MSPSQAEPSSRGRARSSSRSELIWVPVAAESQTWLLKNTDLTGRRGGEIPNSLHGGSSIRNRAHATAEISNPPIKPCFTHAPKEDSPRV